MLLFKVQKKKSNSFDLQAVVKPASPNALQPLPAPTPLTGNAMVTSADGIDPAETTWTTTHPDATATGDNTFELRAISKITGKQVVYATFVGEDDGSYRLSPTKAVREVVGKFLDDKPEDLMRELNFTFTQTDKDGDTVANNVVIKLNDTSVNATAPTTPPQPQPDEPAPPQDDNSLPVASIFVQGDLGKQRVSSGADETYELQATKEDSDKTTGLTYTVQLSKAAAEDTVVTVELSGEAAKPIDIRNISDAGNVKIERLPNNTVQITIPKGKQTATFLVDPVHETDEAAFNYEGEELLIATVKAGAGYEVSSAAGGASAMSEATAGASAIGVVFDGNPISIPALDGDMTLYYGQSQE